MSLLGVCVCMQVLSLQLRVIASFFDVEVTMTRGIHTHTPPHPPRFATNTSFAKRLYDSYAAAPAREAVHAAAMCGL